MTKEIKDILEKHFNKFTDSYDYEADFHLNNAIIEICELQKIECAYEIKDINYEAWVNCINTKNIAENE